MNTAQDEPAFSTDPLTLQNIPPFLRVLLVTDGTVTRSLEAYFLEPIDVEVLEHEETRSAQNYPGVEVRAGESIVKRRVILRGRKSGTAYALAESTIASTHVPEEVRHRLVDEQRGIGDLLNDHRFETYRELLGARRGVANDWAALLRVTEDAAVAIRAYRIFIAGRPFIEIREVFPISRFV